MRISDWSSDVCSSDLDGLDALAGDPGQAKQLGAPGILADRLPQRGLLLLAGLGVQRVHLVEGDDLGLFGEAAAVGLQLRADGSVGDRKSAVEGKRVSVRVDLGGRRIITKKKKQT